MMMRNGVCNVVKAGVLGMIRAYQWVISPLFPASRCRFLPTCSEYSALAFARYPAGKALWLSLKRIARCHPFSRGGVDEP
jgi:putative membrane protein insertion efficiency factor